jgi:hypothetical protein
MLPSNAHSSLLDVNNSRCDGDLEHNMDCGRAWRRRKVCKNKLYVNCWRKTAILPSSSDFDFIYEVGTIEDLRIDLRDVAATQ